MHYTSHDALHRWVTEVFHGLLDGLFFLNVIPY